MKKLSLNDQEGLPYQQDSDYLEDLFIWLDLYLLEKTGTGPEHSCEAETFLRRRLQARGLEAERLSFPAAADWKQRMENRRRLTGEAGGYLALEEIRKRIDGDDFVRSVLALSLLTTLNREYDAVLKNLCPKNGGYAVTLSSCVYLFLVPDYAGEIRAYAAAQWYRLYLSCIFPGLEEGEGFGEEPLICDMRLTDILLNHQIYLPDGTSVFQWEEDCGPLFFRKASLGRLIARSEDTDAPPVLLWGEKGAGKKYLLKHLAKECRTGLIFYEITKTDGREGAASLKKKLFYAIRECIFFDRFLAVTHLERLKKEDFSPLLGWLGKAVRPKTPGVFLLYDGEEYDGPTAGVEVMELEKPDAGERLRLWKSFLGDCVWEEGGSPEALAGAFVLTPGQIENAVRQAGKTEKSGVLREETLYQACYLQLNHQMEKKAVRVRLSFGWEDLKLPPGEKELLRDICHCVKNRHRVLYEWNFGEKVPYGGGITVLFSGPPGTGKTMATQVIARELHMELYQVDLSQVIDKYVGETEKNIRQIFRQAKKSGGILFFDEADAVFHRRMEVSGANERFANMESSLLLQCIEEYGGVVILATNNRDAMDPAFIRRFRYYLPFREPEEAVRYEIWTSVFPDKAPLCREIDFRELARVFDLTGAVIKNVALNAAFLAAGRQDKIRLLDILKSIRREMAKNNLLLTREKMGAFRHLFDEMTKESGSE